MTKVESLYNDIYVYRQDDGDYLLSFGARRLRYIESIVDPSDELALPVYYTQSMTAGLAYADQLKNAMIIGLGSDLCNIDRIQNSLDRFGGRFENRVFTEIERAKARRRQLTTAATYAKRFAAKEAFSKAVGSGFRAGVLMKDIGVVNARSGAPTLALTGGAALRLAGMIPSGHEAIIHLTLTDDHPWAMAVVVIEALPE